MFDRDRWVSTVEVVEVDVIDSQPRQGLVEGLLDVLWVTLHDPAWFSMTETKLGGKEDLIAFPGPFEPMLRAGTVSKAKIYGGGMRTILQLDLRCRHRRRRCPRRYTQIRKLHPGPVARTKLS